MAANLSSRKQTQLAWLQTLPRKYDQLHRAVELLSAHQVDETQLRSTKRQLEELKSQATQLGLGSLGESFGTMAMLLRRPGGHQVKVRGLRELLVGLKVNHEGALRMASTPDDQAGQTAGKGATSP